MMEEDALREVWLAEAKAEAQAANPLVGYCRRVYFQRTGCRRRSGPHKGQQRKYTSHEVEFLKFLPSGRCVQVRDIQTPGLDALAEEVFANYPIPPHTTASQLFLDYFRQL